MVAPPLRLKFLARFQYVNFAFQVLKLISMLAKYLSKKAKGLTDLSF